jgi:hypothetical protein
MSEIDRNYHLERARTELDAAYRAAHTVAAEAHIKLSALHMARLDHANRRSTAASTAV